MLRTRVLTAAIALPAILAAILFLPNWAFSLLIGVLGLWGLYEIFEISPTRSVRILVDFLLLGSFMIWLLVMLKVSEMPLLPVVLLLVAVAMTAMVFTAQAMGVERLRRYPALSTLVTVASVGLFFPYFALLRNGPNGIALVILMLLLVVCADSGAYFVGRAIGRHKLAFKVSPGKTVEGAIGGILASIAGGLILRGWLVAGWSVGGTAVFSAIIALLAIIGDLANSAFKRVAGVKDSGWIFPGHGGLLDRTCSLVLAAVFTYYYS